MFKFDLGESWVEAYNSIADVITQVCWVIFAMFMVAFNIFFLWIVAPMAISAPDNLTVFMGIVVVLVTLIIDIVAILLAVRELPLKK